MSLRYILAVLALVLFAPLLLLQGWHLRRHAIRLPPAQGPRRGVEEGASPALTVLILGESTAAGVGANHHGESLAGQLAKALGKRLAREIRWEVAGQNGLTAARTATELLPRTTIHEAAMVVLALGVNDTLALRTPRRWLTDLQRLIALVQKQYRPRLVAISAVPPVGRFVAIPQPLRTVFGLVAQSLDLATRRAFSDRRDVLYVPLPIDLQNEERYLSIDGFHPSAAGYAVWAGLLAETIAREEDRRTREGAAISAPLNS